MAKVTPQTPVFRVRRLDQCPQGALVRNIAGIGTIYIRSTGTYDAVDRMPVIRCISLSSGDIYQMPVDKKMVLLAPEEAVELRNLS